ncbi:DUF3099 domain-containing protein [Microbacterium sp. XT11]|uniref:DUF3099 domain-containing protein n=1 Tax=Microbacterium sp. XT11 TaxID=367477 RepID=UPI0009FA9881|nr:DUF3099 domain-containing protein [Microbacterium sp. XT11]
MKNKHVVPAVTSLPQSPGDEADHRVRRYAITMTIRIVCFGLMVLVHPYGWYTWVFGIAAAVLPYIAVVFANAGSDSTETVAESPVQQLEATPSSRVEPHGESPGIVTIHESRQDTA